MGRHVVSLLTHYPDFGPTSLFFLLNAVYREATNNIAIDFGLTRPGLKPTSSVLEVSTLTMTPPARLLRSRHDDKLFILPYKKLRMKYSDYLSLFFVKTNMPFFII